MAPYFLFNFFQSAPSRCLLHRTMQGLNPASSPFTITKAITYQVIFSSIALLTSIKLSQQCALSRCSIHRTMQEYFLAYSYTASNPHCEAADATDQKQDLMYFILNLDIPALPCYAYYLSIFISAFLLLTQYQPLIFRPTQGSRFTEQFLPVPGLMV